MKKIALFFSLFCMSLAAAPEYDIVLLAPEGEEFTSESEPESLLTMNDAGYVAGTIRREYGELVPFIYHADFGFKTFDLPVGSKLDREKNEGVHAVNSHGISVGLYNSYPNYYYRPRVFVCNAVSGECYDLLDAFGTELKERSVIRIFITDENKVVFQSTRSNWYWNESDPDTLIHIYDLNSKTEELFSEKGLADVNLKGQKTGDSWFYDLETGVQKLGSLDQFNRWSLKPEALSKNGIVAGLGLDSHREEKGFVWSPDFGIHSFDLIGEWPMILGVNDKGSVVWTAEVEDEYYEYDRSFIFSLEKGWFDLGSLGGLYTAAFGINQQDQVVGSSETKKGKDRAFIWDFENGMRDLSTLIPENVGWKALKKAVKINDQGCIIGSGKYFGYNHHFLLIPRK